MSEIKGAAKTDSLYAGEGVVVLLERLWPALMDIDTSSGALGAAVHRTLDQLIPILIAAPADIARRRQWLERLFEAAMDDGVGYLAPLQERWGEVAVYPELMLDYAERCRTLIRDVWTGKLPPGHVVGAPICFSCLLELGLYGDLMELLADDPQRTWGNRRYGAEALARQKMWEAALAYAENSRHERGYDDPSIDRFCERILIEAGRWQEAFQRYGLKCTSGVTYLVSFRALARRYPGLDPRAILTALIETSGERGKWFEAAKEAGFFDIALICAEDFDAEPETLARAVRDYAATEPGFAMQVGLAALDGLLLGSGYDPEPALAQRLFGDLMSAADRIGARARALAEARRLAERPCGVSREPMRQQLLAALAADASRGSQT